MLILLYIYDIYIYRIGYEKAAVALFYSYIFLFFLTPSNWFPSTFSLSAQSLCSLCRNKTRKSLGFCDIRKKKMRKTLRQRKKLFESPMDWTVNSQIKRSQNSRPCGNAILMSRGVKNDTRRDAGLQPAQRLPPVSATLSCHS